MTGPGKPKGPPEIRVELVPSAVRPREPRIEMFQTTGRCTCAAFPIGLTTTSPGERW